MTLPRIKKIIKSVSEYSGKSMDFEAIVKHCGEPSGDVAQVIEFLQELERPSQRLSVEVDLETPLDLAQELQYNYLVGKSILQSILEEPDPDKDELRKTLTTIQKYMDSMLKMQEKVYNVQQMQRFQEAVLEVLSGHKLKDVIVGQLLELPL